MSTAGTQGGFWFVWLHWVLAVTCGIFTASCRYLLRCMDSLVVTSKLSGCSTREGLLFHGMWALSSPQPGIKPASLPLQGRFLTTGHQGHPQGRC